MSDEFVVVLTTMPAAGEAAKTLARTLVTERLAACANLLPPMLSIYRWEGEVQEDEERQVVIKTTRARVPALLGRLRALHPYDVPEFIVLPVVDGSEPYLDWIRGATSPEPV
jgi:periplasmic divalent cation tolerance protein